MATVFESSFLSSRLHRIEERYEDPANTFGKCDHISYTYLAVSVVLFTAGTVITIFSLGDDADGHVLSKLEMWFIGPIFVCSGLTLAVKCMLYLRKKSVVRRMIFHRHHCIRHLQEFAGTRGMGSIGTAVTLGPPSYEVIVQEGTNELPPPSYAEALAVLHRTIENDAKSSSTAASCGSIAAAKNIRCKP